MDDAREHGTIGQNAELVGAAGLDAVVDAPVWLFNKLTGGDVPAPLDLSSQVYASQTAGQFVDTAGHVLTPDQVEAGAQAAEAAGAVLDAGVQTAGDVARDPLGALGAGVPGFLSLVPTWVLIVGGVAVAGVVGYYVVTGLGAAKALAGKG